MIDDNEHFRVIAKSYPKIAAELRALWGTSGFNPYLEDLEQDKSVDHRAGFPEAVLMALIALGDLHDTKFPHLKPSSKWLS